MKKLLSGIIAIAVLVGLATNVKAASISATPSTVKKGDTVTVKISMSATNSFNFDLAYDTDALTYVSATSAISDTLATDNSGVVSIAAMSLSTTTDYATITFTAKKDTEAANFTVSGFASDVASDSVATPTTTVKITEDTTAGDNTNTENNASTGTTESAVSTTETSETASNDKVDDQGNKITKLPQTGMNYVAIAGIVLMVVLGAVIVTKK